MKLDGDLLRQHRATQGLTQAALANRAGYDPRTIQRAEAGEPVLNAAAATIAQALNVPVDRLRARQGDLHDDAQSPEPGVVSLVECTSGRILLNQVLATTFLTVERDFDPRPEHREVATQFGAFIDNTWVNPWLPRSHYDPPSEEQIFEWMIEAGEIIEALRKVHIRLMSGAYTVLHERFRYSEFGEVYVRSDAVKDTEFGGLILCLTDRNDNVLRRSPEDHWENITF